MSKIVTFGEMLLRLNPEGHKRFIQADKFNAIYGGSEANVATSLTVLGEDTVYVTKLPKHEIGQKIVNQLRSLGIDTSKIARGGERVGIYFCEAGASQRGSKIIYDRANSAVSKAVSADFDWDSIFDGADWFHFTGITPALSETLAQICLEALKCAKKHNVTVSCDLNYRANLWSKEQASRVMTGLMDYVDVCIASEDEVEDVFGIVPENNGEMSCVSIAKQLINRFNFKNVAVILREIKSALKYDWSAMLMSQNECVFSRHYDIDVVDFIGGGDAFGAGLIYALVNKYDLQSAAEFASAAGCLKYSVEGDANLATLDEIQKLAGGNASGKESR